MRVYLPFTLPVLAAAIDTGALGPAPLVAYAVTPALREWYASGDLEELEYAALSAAARASLRLLAADGSAPARRVVAAADVSDAVVSAHTDPHDAERAAVALAAPVERRHLAAVHVDDPAAEPDLRAAAAALAAADAGDEDARFTVSGAEAHELLWYAVQELPALLRSDPTE